MQHRTMPPVAREFMTAKLITLAPDTDALEACDLLVRHQISGAPVVDEHHRYFGVFSEKSVMQLLVDAATENVPTGTVSTYMNRDRGRTIAPDTSFLSVVQMFLNTPYRRLPVLDGDVLVGQVSRRDVLLRALEMTGPEQPHGGPALLYLSAVVASGESPVG